MLTSEIRAELGGAHWHTAINCWVNVSSWDHARVTAPIQGGRGAQRRPSENADSAQAH